MPEFFALLVIAGVFLAIVYGVVKIARAFVARIVVQEYERAVLFRNGRLVGALEPGAYWLRTLFPAHTWRIVDLRERVQVVPGQEIPTSDAVSVKISLAVVFSVVDPVKAVLQAENFQQVLYNALQVVLRDAVAALDVDALLEKRAELGTRLQEQTAPQLERYGLTLHSAQVRDIMFPGT
ncbi:MAG: SPFH domain-containing protein, partial [FCB group bacterium]|nr:SPFH domain-containing protein [FCB group bacterium]